MSINCPSPETDREIIKYVQITSLADRAFPAQMLWSRREGPRGEAGCTETEPQPQPGDLRRLFVMDAMGVGRGREGSRCNGSEEPQGADEQSKGKGSCRC